MKSLKRQCLLVSAAVVVLTLTGSVVAYVAYDIDDATVPSTAKNLPVATELPDGPLLPAFELILPKASELSENECLCLETARDLYAIFTTTGDGKTLTTQAQTTLARIAQWPGDGEDSTIRMERRLLSIFMNRKRRRRGLQELRLRRREC